MNKTERQANIVENAEGLKMYYVPDDQPCSGYHTCESVSLMVLRIATLEQEGDELLHSCQVLQDEVEMLRARNRQLGGTA